MPCTARHRQALLRNALHSEALFHEVTMKRIRVTIVGLSPLLQNRFTEANEAATKGSTRRAQIIEDETPRQAAEKCAYKDDKGRFFFPGPAISRLLRDVGSNHKQKGSRRSLKYIMPSAVRMLDDQVVLTNGDERTPAENFEVDSRAIVNPATKGRRMKHRPRFDKWSATFEVQINEKVMSVETVHMLLSEGGEGIGIGDFRPEKGGPFGTFRVTHFEEVTT